MKDRWRFRLVRAATLWAVAGVATHATAGETGRQIPTAVEAFLDNRPDAPAQDPVRERIEAHVLPALKQLAESDILVSALRVHNTDQMILTMTEIETLDRQWRRAVKTRHHGVLDPVLKSDASALLQEFQAKHGINRLVLASNRGLLTAAAQPVSAYLPSSTAEWRRIYLGAPGATFMEKISGGNSYNEFYRVALGVRDPAQREAIGVLIAEIRIPGPELPKAQSASAESGYQFNLR